MPGHPYGCPIYSGLGLLACPPYRAALANMSFESAVSDTYEAGPFPDGWQIEGADARGRRFTDGGWRGPGYYRLSPLSGEGTTVSLRYKASQATFAATWGTIKAETDYHAYVVARCRSGASGKLRLRVSLFDAGAGAQGVFDTDFVMAATGDDRLPVDSTWRLYRSHAIQPTAAQRAATKYLELRVQAVPTGTFGANVLLELDDAWVGVPIDTNFLGRQQPEHPFEVDVEAIWEDEAAFSGAAFHRAFHTDKNVGVFRVQGVQPGGEREARNFLRGAGDGSKISVMFDFNDTSRDYYPAAVLTGDDDGVKQGIGAYSDLEIMFRETAP